jgi:hypothetical protein
MAVSSGAATQVINSTELACTNHTAKVPANWPYGRVDTAVDEAARFVCGGLAL